MQSIAETCVRFDAAHLSINLVSEIAVPMFTTLMSTVGVRCAISQIWPKFREMLGENPADIHL